MPTWEDYKRQNGLNMGNYSQAEQDAIMNGYGNLMPVAPTNPLMEVNNAPGLMGLSNGQWNNVGQAAGLAGTAVGLYSKLFGDEKKSYELNKKALETNMANVAEDRARHKAFTGNFGGGFNKAMGQGLAASATRVG